MPSAVFFTTIYPAAAQLSRRPNRRAERPSMTDRVLVNTDEPNADSIRLALSEANLLGQKLKCNVIICVSNKKTVGSTVLSEVISPGRINKLIRGLSIQLTPIVTVSLESDRTIATQRGPAVVIALFAVAGMMETIDSMPDCRAVIMLPMTVQDGDLWKEKWNARVLPVI